MAIFLTGASGFLGGAIAEALVAQGEKPHLLLRKTSRLPSERARLLEQAPKFIGDIGDPQSIVTAARGCDLVIHVAGLSHRHSAHRALQWIHIAGTENVLNAARYVGARRMIYVSCADATLVNSDRMYWNEGTVSGRGLLGEHSRSKALAEEVALGAGGSGMDVVVLRPSTVWGPGDASMLPELHNELRVSGGIVLPGKGRNFLALLHIRSLVDGVLRAAHASDVGGRLITLSDMYMATAAEFYGQLSSIVGAGSVRFQPYHLSYLQAAMRERRRAAGLWRADVALRGRSSCFDVSRAVDILGFVPKLDLAADMQDYQKWIAEHGGASEFSRAVSAPATDAAVDDQVRVASGKVL